MRRAIYNYLYFVWRCVRLIFEGDWRYYTWIGFLLVLMLLGINAYMKQFVHGLVTTGMSDQVSWGCISPILPFWWVSPRRPSCWSSRFMCTGTEICTI